MADRQIISQIGSEATSEDTGNWTLSQVGAESASYETGKWYVSQVEAEVESRNIGKWDVSQVGFEVIYTADLVKVVTEPIYYREKIAKALTLVKIVNDTINFGEKPILYKFISILKWKEILNLRSPIVLILKLDSSLI